MYQPRWRSREGSDYTVPCRIVLGCARSIEAAVGRPVTGRSSFLLWSSWARPRLHPWPSLPFAMSFGALVVLNLHHLAFLHAPPLRRHSFCSRGPSFPPASGAGRLASSSLRLVWAADPKTGPLSAHVLRLEPNKLETITSYRPCIVGSS